jgi:protein gp37
MRAAHHTFQILTKRPERMREWVQAWVSQGGEVLPHVWLGVSVENQETADERIPLLLRTPAAVRFLSVEPLLGPINLRLHGLRPDWIIVGGESGPDARKCRISWVRGVVGQCQKWKVPVFVKQLGTHVIDRNDAGFDGHEPDNWPDGTETDDWDLDPCRQYQGADARILLSDSKGADPAEWPEDLRLQEFPATRLPVTVPLGVTNES